MSTVSQALGLPPEEAIAYLRAKTAVTSETYLDIWQRANVKAFTVAGASTRALAQDFLDEIVKAAETGSTQRDFAASFDELVAKHGWSHSGSRDFRSRIIYETNLSVAYSAGRYSQMVEPETLAQFPYWEYVHSGSPHPRLDHKSLNGLVLRCDDPWWSTHYTPNGWGCGCWVRPVSARDLVRYGKSGPDKAPPVEYRTWTNRKTGKVEQVPKGIDPGWDYNPGAEYLGLTGGVTMPAGATLAPRSRTLGEALERARRVTDAAPAGGSAIGAAGGNVGAGAPAAPATVRRFAGDVLSGAIKDRERSVVVARLDDAVAEALETAARDVELSAFRIMKVAGRAEEMDGLASTAHPEVTADVWADLGLLIEGGDVYVKPGDAYRQVLIHGQAGNRTMMAVVRVVRASDGKDRLIVPTYSESGRRRFRRLTKGMRLIRSQN